MTKKILLFAVVLLSVPFADASDTRCRGTLYLTIDTGSMSQAELIARTLKDEDIKATFFLANEKTVRGDHTLDPSWDGFWKALAQDGNAFGNHTWSHHWAVRDDGDKIVMRDAAGKTRRIDEREFCGELNKVAVAFHRATGQELSGLWRAPGGHTTGNSIRFAASCGYPQHVHWSDAGFLGDELPSDKYPNRLLLDRALKNIKSGDVLMMHTGIWSRKDPFAPMLKPLIQGLKARGYCFATIR